MSSEHYVRVLAEPPWTEESAVRLIEHAKKQAMRLGIHRILFDLQQCGPPSSEMVRYYSGAHLAEQLRHPYRVAAVAKPENINYFGEDVAVNRGAIFRVFTDEASALEWLLA